VHVRAHPPDPRWEHTSGGSPLLSAAEFDAIEAFVSARGLVVLGEEQDKYANNLNALLACRCSSRPCAAIDAPARLTRARVSRAGCPGRRTP
jgi:hypothetical protein